VGALGDQVGEPVAAGDQHEAGRRARQERTDLLGVVDVVQDDEHAPVGQQTAVQGRPPFEVRRDPGVRRPECEKDVAQRVEGLDRSGGRAGAAQVDEELAVGEPDRHLVRPVHGQGGLAGPGRPRQHRDDHTLRMGHVLFRQGGEPGELTGASGEGARRGGQLPRHGTRRRVARREPDVRLVPVRRPEVLPQHPHVGVGQFLARVEPEFAVQP